ncbi:hypothetical protein ACI65C_004790 [Semiaphis heraclei]
MKRIAVMSNNCTPSIDREAADTGQLCLFVVNLFDSANGNVIKPTPGKDLRSAVTLTSPHWVFWSKALDVLRSMKYETTKKIPSIANWITTIQGLQLILINNFTSTHSVGANCEDDDSDGILDNLKDFLFNEIPLNEENEDEENCSAQHDALTTNWKLCLKRARLREGAIPENLTLGLGVNNSFIDVAGMEWNNTPLTKKRKKPTWLTGGDNSCIIGETHLRKFLRHKTFVKKFQSRCPITKFAY